jgi:uncharacterized repeat protein (TIGR01451 family)
VQNIGTQDATGVVVRDPLPAGTRFREVSDISDHNFTCSHNGPASGAGVVECVGGMLRGTHDHTLTPDVATIKVVLFAPTAPGFIKNQVRVDPDNALPEIVESNNINTRLTDIELGGCCAFNEFTIDKTQKFPAGDVAPSGVLEYDIKVGNVGSDVAFGVAVRDFIPSGATFRYAEDTLPGTGAFSCTAGDGVINCVGGTLDGTIGQTPAAGDSVRTIHVGLFAPTQPGTYTNQAIVDPDNAIPEADETNNSDAVTTKVVLGGGGSYIDLLVDSAQTSPVDGGGSPQDVVPHGTLAYTLTVENVGTAVAFGVRVEDKLPVGSTFRSAADLNPGSGAFTCSESGGLVTCTSGTLDGSNNDTPAAGDNVRKIVVNVFAPTQPGNYVNQAEVDPNHQIAENDETNNSDSTTTRVALAGEGNYTDLKVKSIDVKDLANADLTEPTPGQQYKYVVTVENTGTDVAFNVGFRGTIDPEATYVKTVATNDFTCGESNSVVTCDGGTLDGSLDQVAGTDATATITIFVKAPLVHDYTYSLQTKVDPTNAIAESNEANNSLSKDVTVKSKVDLTVTVDDASAAQGTEGDWTFQVNKTGSDPVNNVKVVFNLGVGAILLDASAPAGWSCQVFENPVNQAVCVGTADSSAADFTVHYYRTSDNAVHSTAVVDPDNTIVETNENNNTGSGTNS